MTERRICSITNPVRDVMFVEKIASTAINSAGVICENLSEYLVQVFISVKNQCFMVIPCKFNNLCHAQNTRKKI